MKNILLIVTSIILLASCQETNVNKNSYKPQAVGKQGHVLVVLNTKLWNSQIGKLIKKNLAPDITYYPQTEHLFDLIQNDKSGFNRGTKRHKNIVQFEINKHPEIKSGINYLTDIWALDQVVIKITGKSQQDLAQVFVDNAIEIRDYLSKIEMNRIKLSIDQNKNHLAEKELQNKHNLSVTVPVDMELAINNNTFAALERKRLRRTGKESSYPSGPGDIQQYILIYHYPYTSDSTFTKKYQIAKRDSVLKKYMEGRTKDSYMTTASEELTSLYTRETLMKNAYAYEVRGQYSMVNDVRGGPFVSTSIVDERRGRVITIEGNVFCPKFNKREFMLELETIINSLSLY